LIRRIAPCNDTLLPLEHFYLPPSIYLSFLLLLGAHYSLHQPQQVIARSPTRGTTEQSHPLPTLPPRGGGKGWGGIATPFGLAMTDSELWKCKLFHAPPNNKVNELIYIDPLTHPPLRRLYHDRGERNVCHSDISTQPSGGKGKGGIGNF
jgi:hypothetical protein